MEDFSYIKRNFDAVTAELREISASLGREAPTLCAVTKSGSDDELIALAACGVTDIGENRPQELVRRAALLHAAGYSPRLHEIGNLQKNKVRQVIPVASLIQSVGSLALAAFISDKATDSGITVPVLAEINSGEEENKGGILPGVAEETAAAMAALPGIRLIGLMTMGPAVGEGEIRPYFRLTREIFDALRARGVFETDAPTLSMGMSDSYRTAIEEGATLVRIGRRLFSKEQ